MPAPAVLDRGSYYAGYPIPEPTPNFVTAFVTGGKLVHKTWPAETAHLFPEGEQRPMIVAAKLRPLIVLSRGSEMAKTGAALVIPCSRYVAAEWRDQASAVEANQIPHLHWLPASERFRSIASCTLDFRWTYRIPVTLLQMARADAPKGWPRGPVASLSDSALAETLRRAREYLS